jgi:hypothetical protein
MPRRYMEDGGIAPPILTSALHRGEWLASRPGRFTPGDRVPCSRLIGGWVGPRASLDAMEWRQIFPLPGLEPRPCSP